MRKATKTTASWLGIVAGIAGLEHGYFEILQGDKQIPSLSFPSIGPPCDPETTWNTCEPAMSILPNFLITGIIAVIVSSAIIIWSGGFLHKKHAGLVLILVSIAMLLFGGGFFPPLISLVGGLSGTKIIQPIKRKVGSAIRWTANLWPRSLILITSWLLGQFLVGYFFNDFMMTLMWMSMILIFIMLPLSVLSAFAYDATRMIENIEYNNQNLQALERPLISRSQPGGFR